MKQWGAALVTLAIFLLAIFIKTPAIGSLISVIITLYAVSFMAGMALLTKGGTQ